MSQHDHDSLSDEEFNRRLYDRKLMKSAIQEAIHNALRKHKLAGNAVCTWRDGKVVWIPPGEIPVDLDPPGTQS